MTVPGTTDNIYTTRENAPVTMLFGIGKAVSTGDNPQKLTFADIAWSRANGDPADKPAGQDWISDPEAVAKYGQRQDVYSNQYQDVPEKLLRETWEELQKRCKPSMTITANVQDMEMTEGFGHQQVRLWDTAAIVKRNGTALESTIINIERDYVTPWLTKITLGNEEHASIAQQMANNQKALEQLSNRVGGHGAGIDENKEFIVKDQELILLHTQQLDEQGTKLNEASITLNNAVITLEAHQKTLDENGERISFAEVAIDGLDAEIQLKVGKNGVIAAINLTPEEATIQAKRINLDGYVTSGQLNTELADIRTTIANSIDTKILTCETAQITNITLINRRCVWKTGSYVTSVTFPKYQEVNLYYKTITATTPACWYLRPRG